MTNTELKAAVAERLAKDGIWLNLHLSMRDIITKVEAHTGIRKAYRQNGYDYLFKFAGLQREYTEPRWTPPFRPLSMPHHPRADDIERSQPPFMTPRGAVGNGDERSLVWRR
jgi:hypothetical protein